MGNMIVKSLGILLFSPDESYLSNFSSAINYCATNFMFAYKIYCFRCKSSEKAKAVKLMALFAVSFSAAKLLKLKYLSKFLLKSIQTLIHRFSSFTQFR